MNKQPLYAYIRNFNGEVVAVLAATSTNSIGLSVRNEIDSVPEIENSHRIRTEQGIRKTVQTPNGEVTYVTKGKFKTISAKAIGQQIAIDRANEGAPILVPKRKVTVAQNAYVVDGKRLAEVRVPYTEYLDVLVADAAEALYRRAQNYFK